MKKCPLCNAEIADDLINCGNHNSVTISMSGDPIADALAAARSQLLNRTQALVNAQKILAALLTQVTAARTAVSVAQTAVSTAQANVDTLSKFIGGDK